MPLSMNDTSASVPLCVYQIVNTLIAIQKALQPETFDVDAREVLFKKYEKQKNEKSVSQNLFSNIIMLFAKPN